MAPAETTPQLHLSTYPPFNFQDLGEHKVRPYLVPNTDYPSLVFPFVLALRSTLDVRCWMFDVHLLTFVPLQLSVLLITGHSILPFIIQMLMQNTADLLYGQRMIMRAVIGSNDLFGHSTVQV